ncbi:MAG: putative choline dehydrogenase [Solirubrobacterales bacterium]|nr:putative choline dehydrogenase [Solirubrobacterales bacterium]
MPYDYVIVGAGSAGCVLAARLSEDPDVKVALIEAGPPDSMENIHVPLAFAQLFKTRVDWDYSTTPEPGLDRRRVYLPRGRMLGGSSSINAMIYIRGHRADYDEWRDLGNAGWGYDDLLPYFKRAEDNERGADAYHGVGGPLTVSEGRSRHPWMDSFMSAVDERGLPRNPDFNGREQDGFGYYQLTQRDGKRCSAAVAYLHPAMERSNLTVETDLLVHKVLLDGGRAVGVAGDRLGEPLEFRAEREVILAGGAYNSPQLLQLSGIGPAELLTLLEIPVVVDNPMVGQNLHDHPAAGAQWTTDRTGSLAEAMTEENLARFAEGVGPLTSNAAETGGFLRTRDDLPAPDIQFHILPALFLEEGLAPTTDNGMIISVCLVKPASRGSVLIRSAEPSSKPAIVHNYYAEESDVESMVAGLRHVVAFGATAALAPYCQTPVEIPASDSEEDLRAHLRAYTQTIYHPVGTCSMGQVVDDELRVQGVDGLRVVDASVMPTVPRGNTNAPVIAVAERAADLIRGRTAPAEALAEPAAAPA